MSDHTSVFYQIYLSQILKLYRAELIKIFDANFLSYQLTHKRRKDIFLVLPTNDINLNCLNSFLGELSLFDEKQKYGNCYICVVPKKESLVEECTNFNGKSFVHFVFLDFQKNKIVYDKNFYYFGSRHIKNLIEICEEVFKHQSGDGMKTGRQTGDGSLSSGEKD